MDKITLDTAEQLRRGDAGTGWVLKKSPEISVVERILTPGVKEIRHYHRLSWQFFYVLSGKGTMIIDRKEVPLIPGESVEVDPLTPHQFVNTGEEPLRYLVVSRPNSFEDRVTVD